MVTTTTGGAATGEVRTDELVAAGRVLLRRAGLVAPGLLSARGFRQRGKKAAGAEAGIRLLESDLLAVGYRVGPRLHAYLRNQPPEKLASVGLSLLDAVYQLLGADVPHVPLFRKFPRSVPGDTDELYVTRVFTLLLQEPWQPCVLCGKPGTVVAVAPCAHLVCRRCWDLADYTGCPLCHRRIDITQPFLSLARPPLRSPREVLPRRTALIELADDVNRICHELIGSLLGRRTPLSKQDRDDLAVLLDQVGHGDLGWLPERIPVRETSALVLARLLRDPAAWAKVPALLAVHLRTATDVLRLLYAWQGADPGLISPPARRRSPPRWLRRLLLERLDGVPVPALVEDLLRHRTRWVSIAENLHPFEYAGRYPRAAAGFAVLRRTRVDPATRLGRSLSTAAAEHPEVLRLDRGRLRARTWSGAVERCLAEPDPVGALRLLRQRPGELVRRLVALTRRLDDDAWLLDAVAPALRSVAPGPLLATLGAVRSATWPGGDRLFAPKGGAARMWTTPDRRPRLAADRGNLLDLLLTEELLTRAAALPPVEVALLDRGLVDLIAPCAERSASATLVDLPRGSSQPVPAGDTLRLFLHWTEPAGVRVDLDLSVALFRHSGAFVGWCDYTRLRFGETAIVHSGDLTSAPAPLGASEFVDLNLAELRRHQIRYVSMVVLSYNGVPFEQLPDAFAGVMADPDRHAAGFDPRAVEQRFDLRGNSRVSTPLSLDLSAGRLRWLDAAMLGSVAENTVRGFSRRLGQLTAAADRYYGSGRRVSMWELAAWHAAARAGSVLVRHPSGVVTSYERGGSEPLPAFCERISAFGPPDRDRVEVHPAPGFAALIRAGLDLRDGAEVFALYRDRLDAARVDLRTAADLVGAFAPAPPAGRG